MTKKRKVITSTVVFFIILVVGYIFSPWSINNYLNEPAPGTMQQTKKDKPEMVEKEPAQIFGTFGHPASGTVRIVKTEGGTFIRYENLQTISGPDVHVYLSKDKDAKDYIDLGLIKGTSGNINYGVPDDVDISEYKYALNWCVLFHVLFNSAEIN